MTVTRSAYVLLGTDDLSGPTISNNTGATGTVTDVLGDDVSMGYANVYLAFTSTVAVGTLDVEIFSHRVSNQEYVDNSLQKFSYAPIDGRQRIFVGTLHLGRYISGRLYNAGTGANITNAFLALERFKVT